MYALALQRSDIVGLGGVLLVLVTPKVDLAVQLLDPKMGLVPAQPFKLDQFASNCGFAETGSGDNLRLKSRMHNILRDPRPEISLEEGSCND